MTEKTCREFDELLGTFARASHEHFSFCHCDDPDSCMRCATALDAYDAATDAITQHHATAEQQVEELRRLAAAYLEASTDLEMLPEYIALKDALGDKNG